MKLVLAVCFVCFGMFSFSQHFLPVQYDTNTCNHEIMVYGIGDFGTTSINMDIGKRLLFGGYITNEMKDRSIEKHKGINRLGLDVSGEIEYRNYKVSFLKKNWGLLVKAGYGSYLSAAYSKDLFGLVFYGNENYLGETVDFSNSKFQAMSFQKIGLGCIDKKTKSNISLNFYTVSNYAEAAFRNGQLFQSDQGDSLSIGLDGRVEYASSHVFVKGMGMGIDLDFRIPFTLRNDKTSYIQILAKNIGFAYFNSKVTRYEADTTFNFNGLDFDQLYGNSSIFKDQFSIFDTLGVDSLGKYKTKLLPCVLQAGKIVDELNPARLQSFYGVRLYPTLSYLPMIYGGLQVRTYPWLKFALNGSYGGFTNFRLGAYAQVDVKKFSMGIGSESIIGFFWKRGRGESLAIRMRYAF